MDKLPLIVSNTQWPATHDAVISSAKTRTVPEDFRVSEIPLVEPDGEGEHLWVKLEQKDWTTQSAVRVLSKWSGARPRDISFAGRKDRDAVTDQWFSIQLPGKADPSLEWDWPEGLKVLETSRHSRKLKTGALSGNRFAIILREVVGDKEAIEARIKAIQTGGIPNYFGPQRFGRDGDNTEQALAFFEGTLEVRKRDYRSTLLSSARSWVFNEVLAERIRNKTWSEALEGDLLNLSGSNSVFLCEVVDAEIAERVKSGDVSPTGPMPGEEGKSVVTSGTAELESVILQQHEALVAGLQKARVAASRRALRVLVPDLTHQWLEDDVLELTFSLTSGSFATALLAELGL